MKVRSYAALALFLCAGLGRTDLPVFLGCNLEVGTEPQNTGISNGMTYSLPR